MKKEEKPGKKTAKWVQEKHGLSLIPQFVLKHKLHHRQTVSGVTGGRRGMTSQAPQVEVIQFTSPAQGAGVGHWQPTPPAAGSWGHEPGKRDLRMSPTTSVKGA